MTFKGFGTPFLILAITLLSFSVPPAQAEVQTNLKVPVTIGVFIPCAAGGAGEDVFLTGNLHVLLRFTMDQAGGIHVASHFQPQGISGAGQTSGDKYQATGVTQEDSMPKSELRRRLSTTSASSAKAMATTFSYTKLFTSHSMPTGFRRRQ